MPFRLIQLSVPRDWSDSISEITEDLPQGDCWSIRSKNDDHPDQIFMLVHTADSQEKMDKISDALADCDHWKLISHSTEAVLPEPEDEEKQEDLDQQNQSAAREEIYADVRNGAILTSDYLVLTGLATLVAAIGLNTGQLAVVIGAMVIAPLLGPIIAFSFGTTLGNRDLLWISLKSLLVGLAVSIAVGMTLGLSLPVNIESGLMNFKEPLGLNTVALPLASGAAAALMVARGNQSALVGVMVAAALLPPIAAFGLLLGAQEYRQAIRAMVTVLVNIVAINLAAQAVFLSKGIRPRSWLSDDYQNSLRWNIGVSIALVLSMFLALYIFGGGGVVSWDN
ncbi:TIGR00341 family protein [Parasulfitobacter algicola]|uniref:TIGR00341 family protein n=1 Tax=Parasulfitobacter algicola TaxID=2614809 RepID=A0ABX2IVI1_9RHOB|nr:TIGR00341 family protein [Sulfitobacter algicola]NSX54053.1 TIGR00341 family protein [Sulfitobacter algicola]